MDEIVKLTIPAIIALLGTIIAVLLSYLQWKRQHDTEAKRKFLDDRKKIYEKLWQMLEEIHIYIRSNSMDYRKIIEKESEVNSYILKNSLFIEKEDTNITKEYLGGVIWVSRLIAQSRDKRLKDAWRLTGSLPLDTLEEFEQLKKAWNELQIFRDKTVTIP
jgi:hypothetical protein